MKSVLSTRTTPEGYKVRRHVSRLGNRYTTIEVPIAVWNSLNRQGRGNDRAAAWTRARERDSKRAQACALAAAGRQAPDISAALDVPLRTIYRWIKP
jgi:hypothetical protein